MTFERFIVVRNPVSTHANRATRRLAEIRRLAPDAELIDIQTRPGGRKANRALLRRYANKLGPNTLLCIVAGDGTISLVADMLLSDPDLPGQARLTPVLPLWGGNANDLAHILNGTAARSLRTLLKRGRIVPVRPLQADITTSDGAHETRLAVCYASFGASAFSARLLGQQTRASRPLDRLYGGRFVRELVHVSRALRQTTVFAIDEADHRRDVYEMAFMNGPRFAKVAGIPLRITDEVFHRATVERKHFWSLIFRAAQLTNRRAAPQMRGHEAAFTVHDATWAQFDGETVQIAAGTNVRIAIASQPFYALASARQLTRQK